MKKIVLKAKVKSYDDFEKNLDEIGKDLAPIIWQHDRVFVPRGYKRGMNFPKIIMRTEMKAVDRPAQYEMILRRHVEDSGIDIIESTVVKDYVDSVNIIYQLGFKNIAEVSRRRQIADLGEGIKIYLDKIDNLNGYYAKMEMVLRDEDVVAEVRDDMKKTFRDVFKIEKFVEQSYFEILEENEHK